MPLQIRRGTNTERQSMSQPLAAGELIYVTDTQQLYIGTGATLGGIPVTGYTNENAQDAAAALFVNGSHTGISFTYNDINNTIEAVVDVSGPITDNIIPDVSETYDIGSPDFKFKDLYLSGNSLFLGDATITSTGTAINLPAGSTVGGVAITQPSGLFVGDLQGSVIGDDSTILVDATNGTLSSGGLILDGDTLYSINFNGVSIYNAVNEAPRQVKFPMIATSTVDGDILTAAEDWKFIEIQSSKDSLSPTDDLQSGDVMGVLSIIGIQASDEGDLGMGSAIGSQVDPAGTVTPLWIPSKLFFINSSYSSEDDRSPIMTFDSFGRLAVNQQNAQATLDVNGFAKLAVLSQEPNMLADGMIAIADGIEWNPLNNGKQSMVVRLGGAWVQLAAAL